MVFQADFYEIVPIQLCENLPYSLNFVLIRVLEATRRYVEALLVLVQGAQLPAHVLVYSGGIDMLHLNVDERFFEP